jgi:transglutaminase-like putative cysteine protease
MPAPRPDNEKAQRPGLDTSAITGRHELPRQANIQGTGEIMLYLRPHDRAVAQRMAQGLVYVRSHTLDDWKDGAWSAAVRGGQWLEDRRDGTADGIITLTPPAEDAVAHTIFLENADGYSLPALQNVSALGLPRVYAMPGDIHQMQAAGSIRYDAVSAPRYWDTLPDRGQLRAGRTSVPAQTKMADSRVLMDLIDGDALLDQDRAKTLSQQVEAVHTWLGQNIKYSKKMDGDPTLTPLDNFLVGERKGYCDFYASAGALMLRFYGVPTRVAYGYTNHEYDGMNGLFIFTDESAHAWTEVLIEGQGWVICDFTPSENIGAPAVEKNRPPSAFNENQFARQETKEPEKPEQKKQEEAGSAANWWKETLSNLAGKDSIERARQTIIWLAMAAALYFLVRLLWRKKKPGDGAEDAFGGDTSQPVYFTEFVRIFQEAGCPRRQGSTPREYFSAVRRRGFTGDEFLPMMEYHYSRRYEDAERDREREETWLTLARAAEDKLRQSRTR